MAMNFGKLNFAVGFNRTSAFVLDANSYFEDLNSAEAAAATACEVGSADSAYYFGQLIIVKTASTVGLYQITNDKKLKEFGSASSAQDLLKRVEALESKAKLAFTDDGRMILASATVDGFMSHSDKAKLDAIPDDAAANKIEAIKVNGVEVSPVAKEVDLTLKAKGQTVDVTGLTGTVMAVQKLTGDLAHQEDTVTSTGTFTPSGTVEGSTTAAGDVSVTLTNNTISSLKTAGTLPSFTEGDFTPASLDYISKEFCTDAMKARIGNSGDEIECLVFEPSSKDTASAITSFSGGSKAADTFGKGTLPVFEEKTIGATATFTGRESSIAATFAGTAGDVSVSGTYQKANKGTLAATPEETAVTITGGSVTIADAVVEQTNKA